MCLCFFFFCKQKTAYEMRISDWSSDVCSSDLGGIGRGIALLLASEGASVVVNDLGASVHGEGASASAAEKVVDEIRAAGGNAVANGDSIASWESAQRIIGQALDTYGRIDGVVNNAGILRDRFFFKMDQIGRAHVWTPVTHAHLV